MVRRRKRTKYCKEEEEKENILKTQKEGKNIERRKGQKLIGRQR